MDFPVRSIGAFAQYLSLENREFPTVSSKYCPMDSCVENGRSPLKADFVFYFIFTLLALPTRSCNG